MKTSRSFESGGRSAAKSLVRILLDEAGAGEVCEASVHRPRRGRVWLATFAGPGGGQTWKSTGVTSRAQALLLAKHWETQARLQRARLGGTAKKPIWRVRSPAGSTGIGPLSQKQVGLLLGMSERGVREVERRALQKLRDNPLLRRVWQKYLGGELDEEQLNPSAQEIEALFNLVSSTEERRLIEKVLSIIQR